MNGEFLQGVLILFFVEFVRGAYLVNFLPSYAVNRLGISMSIVGLAVTVHYVVDTLSKSLLGYLLDRLSPRVVVHSGLLLSFLGLLMTPSSHYPWLLVLANALYGIGVSPIWLVCLSRVEEGQRATQMGLLYTVWLVSLGLGLVVINFFIDWSFLLAYWLLVVLWLFAWLLSLRISNRKTAVMGFIPFPKQLQLLWERLKNMKALLPGMILQTTSGGMLVPVLPSFATKYLGFTYSQYSYVLIVGGICAVLGMIPLGRMSDVWSKKWFLVGGFACIAFALYFLTYSSSLGMAMFWAVVAGVSYASLLPAWNAILSYHVPTGQKGLGWGIFSSVEGIGVMIGPVLGGRIADLFNEGVTVLVSALLLGGISLFYLLFPSNRLLGEAQS